MSNEIIGSLLWEESCRNAPPGSFLWRKGMLRILLSCMFLLICARGVCWSQSLGKPFLVKDSNPVAASYGNSPVNAGEFTHCGDTVYFVANDQIHGRELWETNGTNGGTVLVKDINPTPLTGSNPRSLFDYNGTLIFTADDGLHGQELWKSDGTAAGTVLLKDIFPGNYGGVDVVTPASFAVYRGILYFAAYDPTTGVELWKSDGTSEGTVLVKDLAPVGSSIPAGLTVVGGSLYFGTSGATGGALWKSDGTAEGTVLVKAVSASNLTGVNGMLYFAGTDATHGTELWKSDGTPEGTVLVKEIGPGMASALPTQLTNLNGILFFVAYGIGPSTLWRSDGTEYGTTNVKENGPTYPTELTIVNGLLFFTAYDGSHGRELWKSDGTDQGTQLVKDIVPGGAGSYAHALTNMNGALYFIASAAQNAGELWKSDGSESGTVKIKDINPGVDGSIPQFLVNAKGFLYFSPQDSGSACGQVWKSDGSASGTILVKTIFSGTQGSNPTQLTDFNGSLFFMADGGTNGKGLWKSNGTKGGTGLVKDVAPGELLQVVGDDDKGIITLNGALYFLTVEGLATHLWRSDGTTSGTVVIRDFIATPSPSLGEGWWMVSPEPPPALIRVNESLFLAVNDGEHGVELWRSDGTTAGTTLVKDINPFGGSYPSHLTGVGDTLYFTADDGVNGMRLWKSDGTATGTVIATRVNPSGYIGVAPTNLTDLKGTLLFTIDGGAGSLQLWTSDGTESGTTFLQTFTPSSGQYLSAAMGPVMNGTLFFRVVANGSTAQLWKSDGTAGGTGLVSDQIDPYVGLHLLNGALYFLTYGDDGMSANLWRCDGTPTGTLLLKSVPLYGLSIYHSSLSQAGVGGNLYFSVSGGLNLVDLWQSDGTAEGTAKVQSIDNYRSVLFPSGFHRFQDTIFFTADDGIHGSELWAMGPTLDADLVGESGRLLSVMIQSIGKGLGSVHSIPAGVACSSALCSSLFSNSSAVDLVATPTGFSLFTGWQGDCSGIGSCSVIMDSDRFVSGSFTAVPPVMMNGGTFWSLQAACDVAQEGDIIRGLAQEYMEELRLHRSVKVSLVGGFDASFATGTGACTTVNGSITVRAGSLSVMNLIVR